MDSAGLTELDKFTKHAQWINASRAKWRKAAQLRHDNGRLQLRFGTELKMVVHHTRHRILLADAFEELAVEFDGDFQSLETELKPDDYAK